MNEQDKLNKAIRDSDLEAVQLLIDRDCDVNLQDVRGIAPLTQAVWGYNMDIIKLLLKHGADTNTKDRTGDTPVELCSHRPDVSKILEDYA